MLVIDSESRRALRARAHALNPVVSISQNGLTESVLKEIDHSLTIHELIKVRVYGDERELRQNYMNEVCEKLGAAPVQLLGKLLILWRPSPEKQAKEAAAETRRQTNRRRPARQTKRSFQ